MHHYRLTASSGHWPRKPSGNGDSQSCPARYANPPLDSLRVGRKRLAVVLRGLSFRGPSLETALRSQRECAQSQAVLIDKLRETLDISTSIFTYPTYHTPLIPEVFANLRPSTTTLLEPAWWNCTMPQSCPERIRRRQQLRCSTYDAALYPCHGVNSTAFASGAPVVKVGSGDFLGLQRRVFDDLLRLQRRAPLSTEQQYDLQQPFDAALLMRMDMCPLEPLALAEALRSAMIRSPKRITVSFRIGNHCDWCCASRCADSATIAGSSECQRTPQRRLPRVSDALHLVPSEYFGMLARGVALSENLNEELDQSKERHKILPANDTSAIERIRWGWLEYASTEFADSNPLSCANRVYSLAGRSVSLTHPLPMCELLPQTEQLQ